MSQIKLTINGQAVEVPAGISILEAAREAAIYIPSLCCHPDLPPAKGIEAAGRVYHGERTIDNAKPGEPGKGCGICVVGVEGEPDLVGSCATEIKEGMVVVTENERIKTKRQINLLPIMARHRHACLTCAQQEGCSMTQCSANVPENERCCPQFGHCELQSVANYIGISDSTPKWTPTHLPVIKDDPLFERDYNLCIGCTRCVRACRELRGIEALGFVYNRGGEIQVGPIGPTLKESGCKFCTACVEVCPTGALVDRNVRAGQKDADLVSCREACPAHIDVPGYLRLIAQGKADEANAVIREKVPFPGILGRVCVHPCEDACRRSEVNEPIAICALKRYAADQEKGHWKANSKVRDDTGKRVAIVGAGPAGLTAAFYLRKQGHGVTLFDSSNEAGGMMRYGIPEYRLPRDLIQREIKEIMDLGIDFRSNQSLGKEIDLGQMTKGDYDAVFLGVGAQLSRRISIEGSDLPDVLWGVDFLRSIAQTEDLKLKEKVIVIGGGNVAVDAALSALRCGAKEVTMACLESREEMPAQEWEIQGAVAEGVRLMPTWGPHRILGEKGRVKGIELVQCINVFDDKGNFCPAFGEEKEILEGDQIIMAIGQASDLSFMEGLDRLTAENGLIVVNGDSLETNRAGIYAGGDVTEMPGAIIHAIAAGRKAASSIDKALGGDGEIEEVLFQRDAPSQHFGRDEGFATWPREEAPELELTARHQGFQEVLLGYGTVQAQKEASRCLQCDARLYLGCNPLPPEKWLLFNLHNINEVPDSEGVFQLQDEDHKILGFKGTANLKKDLLEALDENEKAVWFEYEDDKMYSKRESELIQKYLREHGKMPGGGDDDLDDLF